MGLGGAVAEQSEHRFSERSSTTNLTLIRAGSTSTNDGKTPFTIERN